MKRCYAAAIVSLFVLATFSFVTGSTILINLTPRSQPIVSLATTAGKYGNPPCWSPMANTTGAVTVPGDLFVADVKLI